MRAMLRLAHAIDTFTEWLGTLSTALVLVTHSEEAAAVCHERIRLRDGSIER